MNKNFRWKQRFSNFKKAFFLLERTVQIENRNEAERGGLIQFFEISFELSWKTLKDYLESEGYQVKSSREVIKQAYQNEILQDGQVWMEALEDRNRTVHLYDEATSLQIEQVIATKYYPMLQSVYKYFVELD